ncbi:gamma-tubulin complex component 2 [Nematocida parisii]|uniref:Spindle pole body component n=1 Tax=Nematocida parisii (strain ERTm3) TaxID=935791 RepID=I3EI49_NEMP3|nr:hypothetical protein NEQG_00715 [Nematocida parisii ERTm3]KAI5143681.1 gamma-tubulin complex component 2 [Nematocida parisii]KAI5153590.1 gamma-tubulin complex component 2 [Nematocida parisii]KAI5156494.1 gamma-tubulin complex component 2 [Nematocida parisii]
MDSMRKGKEPLLADLLFAMAGVDCKAVRVRQSSGQEMGTFVNSSVPKNSIQIVRELLVIIAGIKKCRYHIENVYFEAGPIRKYLFKAIEEEIQYYLEKVDRVRQEVRNTAVHIEALPFIFQEEIETFTGLTEVLRDADSEGDLFLLGVVLKSRLKSTRIISSLIAPMNRILVRLIQGEDTSGYFEERHTYDYAESFWSSHYRIKEAVPAYLAGCFNKLVELGKISKIRRVMGEPAIKYGAEVLSVCLDRRSSIINEQSLNAYFMRIIECPAVRQMWQESMAELFSRIGLDVSKYSELFQEIGERILKVPSKKDISLVNYLMRKGSAGYSSYEEHVDSPSLSFLDDCTFLLESVEGVRSSPVTFVYNEVSLEKTLLGIYDTRCSKSVAGLSLLQGLDITFSLKEPLSMFFSAKSVYELRIIFRLIYSLYAIEYFLCSQYSNWRIKQVLLSFVTGVRMVITEKIDTEFQTVINEEHIQNYTGSLESALSNIMKASLLTSPFLIQFYSKVFSIAFMYIELANREQLTVEEEKEILNSLRHCFRAAIPYVKSPLLILLFESLLCTEQPEMAQNSDYYSNMHPV